VVDCCVQLCKIVVQVANSIWYVVHTWIYSCKLAGIALSNSTWNSCSCEHETMWRNIIVGYCRWYYLFLFSVDLTTVIASLSPTQRQDKCVSHALQVRSAWALSNYHRLFRLYRSAPKMSGYIMDWFLERERKSALKIIVKSYVVCWIFSFCL